MLRIMAMIVIILHMHRMYVLLHSVELSVWQIHVLCIMLIEITALMVVVEILIRILLVILMTSSR